MYCKVICTYDPLACPFLLQQKNHAINRTRILDAIYNQEFTLYFQPQVLQSEMDDKPHIIQAEALLRWNHDGQILSPGDFIPFAEEDEQGLIKSIGREVLRLTADTLPRWKNISTLQHIPLAINISPRELTAEFFDHMQLLIHQGIFSPQQLLLEITETQLDESHENEMSRILERLSSELKLKLSLDDYGTNGASLNRFNSHPYSEVKLDRKLIAKLRDSNPRIRKRTQDSVINILTQAQQYGCSVVAEGIEDEEDNKNCNLLGLSRYQGFFFYKPMPEKEFIKLVSKYQPVSDTACSA